MASEGSTELILKRRNDEMALMPPPPIKKIKRPSEVLDEDDYTEALSEIIERDYYPGLREAKAQEAYLQALDSKNAGWIREAERELRAAREGEPKTRRTERDTRYDTPKPYERAADTPRHPTGADTPVSTTEVAVEDSKQLDTSQHSLSSYQSKYTSEDNASFNTIVDSQNSTRRKKHAHLWTSTQLIPSQRLLAHRTQQQALMKADQDYETANGKALIPLATGATSSRPAAPQTWKTTNPANTLMFAPQTTIDEHGLQTTAELKESLSKAGPKQIVHENTRFPPSGPRWESADDDDATSIHTSFIARRNLHTEAGDGSETPRVNGYAFVDDEEPEPETLSTYRDLLAGQTGDAAPNPFKLKETRAREDLHHRLVERDAERKRVKGKDTQVGGKEVGNMTPAARRMMERLGGRTPTVKVSERTREDWTPVATPRRVREVVK